MKQFFTIFKFELLGYLKNKIFVGITIFLVIVMGIVMAIPNIIPLFNSGEDKESEKSNMYVKVLDATYSDTIKTSFETVFSEYKITITNDDEDTIKNKVVNGDIECAFIVANLTSYKYYVNNLSMYDTNTQTAQSVLKSSYQLYAMMESGMTPEEAANVLGVQINGEVETLGKDQLTNYFYTYVMIFALYMVILLYGQMVATNVASEKSSRAMELLITSAKPTSMMFGKVIASCTAGLMQLVVIFGSAILFFNMNKSSWDDNIIIQSMFNIPVDLFMYMLLFFVLGFFIYAFLYGAIGSTASKLEDINTSVMPITMFFIIAFIVVVINMSTGTVDNAIMKACSYIPFTSPMAMFTRIAMSTVNWYEILISVIILIGSVIGIGFLSAKIYRAGVLMYGTSPKMKDIIKTVFK